MKLEGAKEVKLAINKYTDDLFEGVQRGIAQSALLVQRESQLIVPVDKGILKASARTRKKKVGKQVEYWVTYGTLYGLYVHEDLTAAHGAEYNQKYAKEIADPKNKRFHSRGPNQQAKFLERALRNNLGKIRAIIKANAKP